MPDDQTPATESSPSRPAETGQLSESADSRTKDTSPPESEKPQKETGPAPSGPGKHGRPTDDTDPGHS